MTEVLSPLDKQELSQLMKDLEALLERGLKLVEKVKTEK